MSLLARLPLDSLRLISFHLQLSAYSTTSRALGDKKAYSHTLLLPKNSIPLKNKAPVQTEERLRKRLSDDLYKRQRDRTGPPFTFLDGPPYANGNLHMGHALNKVLKDIINRYKVLRGYRVHFQPGWDCHGLPIEQKALKEIGKSHTSLDPIRIREIARDTALSAISVQKQEMRELGVMANWDSQEDTYRTMDHDYQIRQLRIFSQMVKDGHIVHRLKPTYYSPASRTALAESELRYVDSHSSRSVYVALRISKPTPRLAKYGPLHLAIWTTTPWTLPANMAVAVGDLPYAIVTTADRSLIVQTDRIEHLHKILGPMTIRQHLQGSDIVGSEYTTPFNSTPRPVISSPHVSTDSGTGLVHMAPAHGHEDYAIFGSADIISPVDAAGCYDHTVDPQLHGLPVLGAGTAKIISLLSSHNVLLAEQLIKHRYPYDWKTKTPVIIRATPQWFANVELVKPAAVALLDKITFTPPVARHRLEAFVTSRSEWCISRQRSWGVPIPVFHDRDGTAVTGQLEQTIAMLDAHGIDHWWKGPIEDFTARKDVTRGTDTLDVWFDSGTAWTSLTPERTPERSEGGARDDSLGHLRFAQMTPAQTTPAQMTPTRSADDFASLRSAESSAEPPALADVCLEGSDQHRGWFQSSLLTRLITSPTSSPVVQNIVTHGFITTTGGQKMSKSEGNGISPTQVIHGGKGIPASGADALRIWIASVDYTKDVSIGPQSIPQASEMLRKLRSVLRFASSYVGTAEAEPSTIDKYVLHELSELERSVREAYDQFAFSRALNSINSFTGMLSALYFDVVKDILYCDSLSSQRRMAVIATLNKVVNVMLRLIAPILPHLAEELNEALPSPYSPCIFDAPWITNLPMFPEAKADTQFILQVRTSVTNLIEQYRETKLLRSGAEVDLTISGTGNLNRFQTDLARLLSVSRVFLDQEPSTDAWTRQHEVTIGNDRIMLTVSPTPRHPCPRCWLHHAESRDELCNRCEKSV